MSNEHAVVNAYPLIALLGIGRETLLSGLFDRVELGFLAPFAFYGIYDETVDYPTRPWTTGRSRGARAASTPTHSPPGSPPLARARHAFKHRRDKAQQRTLAFCVSTAHADFMAERFQQEGIRCAAVYRGSALDRGEALERLGRGDLQVLFSVDLLNEGVDLPGIDTVMMLRPTESKILFLQQLGRGLRRHPDKERLMVLDFIGNHKGFLNKPDALFDCGKRYGDLAAFAARVRDDAVPCAAIPSPANASGYNAGRGTRRRGR